MEKQDEREICSHCGGVIFLEKDRYVILQTNQGKETVEISYYHIKCWGRYWNEKIKEAIMNRARVGMEGLRKMTEKLQKQVGEIKENP
jgi:hypothetical protein